jgi:putative FmdB family regulatory protein
MATYQYRCSQDGDFDVRRPIGTATPKTQCPICRRDAARVFRAPMLSLAPRALVSAIDRTEKTRDEPDVVTAIPTRATRPRTPAATQNPAWRRLPKP